ncbi:MAG: protocatechuate 3,4-dioxygenase subunit alpha [Hyphomicrobiales bacterium]
MSQKVRLKESPSQTAGPYVHIGCMPNFVGIPHVYAADLGTQMIGDETTGERIEIVGCIFDGAGELVKDAMIEIWQADASGNYAGQNGAGSQENREFSGWGRQPVDLETGQFIFQTIKPGRVPYADGQLQAPHVTIWIVARGINLGLSTRLYFSDEASANANDPVLSSLDEARASTLMAGLKDGQYQFDIRLQGEHETVFFDV